MSALLPRLRNKSITTSARVEAAAQIWQDQSINFPKKADFLADWVLNELVKVKDSDALLHNRIWSLLLNLLQSPNLQDLEHILSKIPTLNILNAILQRKARFDDETLCQKMYLCWSLVLEEALPRALPDLVVECVANAHAALTHAAAPSFRSVLELLLSNITIWCGNCTVSIRKKLLATYTEKCLEGALQALILDSQLAKVVQKLLNHTLLDVPQLQKFVNNEVGPINDALQAMQKWPTLLQKQTVPVFFANFVKAVRNNVDALITSTPSSSKASNEYQTSLLMRNASFAMLDCLDFVFSIPECNLQLLDTIKHDQLYVTTVEQSSKWKVILERMLDAAVATCKSPISVSAITSIAQIDFSIVEPRIHALLNSSTLQDDRCANRLLSTLRIGFVETHRLPAFLSRILDHSDSLTISAQELKSIGQSIQAHVQPFEALALFEEVATRVVPSPSDDQARKKKRRKAELSDTHAQLLSAMVGNLRVSYAQKREFQDALMTLLRRLDTCFGKSTGVAWLNLRRTVCERLVDNGAALLDPSQADPCCDDMDIPSDLFKQNQNLWQNQPIIDTDYIVLAHTMFGSARLSLVNARLPEDLSKIIVRVTDALVDPKTQFANAELRMTGMQALMANIDILERVCDPASLNKLAVFFLENTANKTDAVKTRINEPDLIAYPKLREAICAQIDAAIASNSLEQILPLCHSVEPAYLGHERCLRVFCAILQAMNSLKTGATLGASLHLLHGIWRIEDTIWGAIATLAASGGNTLLKDRSSNGLLYPLFKKALASADSTSQLFDFMHSSLKTHHFPTMLSVLGDLLGGMEQINPNLSKYITNLLPESMQVMEDSSEAKEEGILLLAFLRLSHQTQTPVTGKWLHLARQAHTSKILDTSSVEEYIEALLLSSRYWQTQNGNCIGMILAARILQALCNKASLTSTISCNALSSRCLKGIKDKERRLVFDWLESEFSNEYTADGNWALAQLQTMYLFCLGKQSSSTIQSLVSRLLRILLHSLFTDGPRNNPGTDTVCLAILSQLKPYIRESHDVSASLHILLRVLKPERLRASDTTQSPADFHQNFTNIIQVLSYIGQHCRNTLSALFPLFVSVIKGIFAVFQRFSLPEILIADQSAASPRLVAINTSLSDYRPIQAKIVSRFLSGLTQKSRHQHTRKASAAITTLQGPLSKQAPYILQAYVNACADPGKPIPKHITEALKPGLLDVYATMNKFERDSLFKTLFNKHQEVERSILRQIAREHEEVRYKGEA